MEVSVTWNTLHYILSSICVTVEHLSRAEFLLFYNSQEVCAVKEGLKKWTWK